MIRRRHALRALGLILAAATAAHALSNNPDEILGLFPPDPELRFIRVRHILDRADLTQAIFYPGADLEDADFRSMTLKHADLQGARCDRADFLAADCTGADFSGVDLTAARNLARAVVKEAVFRDAIIRPGDLPLLFRLDADLRGVLLGGAEPEPQESKVETVPDSAPDPGPPGLPPLPAVSRIPGEHTAWQMHRLALAFTSRLASASGIPGVDPAALLGISDAVEAALRAGCHALDAEVAKLSPDRPVPAAAQPSPAGPAARSGRPLRAEAEPFQPSGAVSSQEPEYAWPD